MTTKKADAVEKAKVEAPVKDTTDIKAELEKQLAEVKKIKKDLLKQQEDIKKKEQQEKEKKQVETGSNEFVGVVCNIPQFEVGDLRAYELGVKNSKNFVKLQKYGSRGSIQFSDLQEIQGYIHNGLSLGAVLISKKDANVIEYMGLKEMYEKIVYPEDMDDFLNKSTVEEIKKVMIGCPERMKEAFIGRIRYNKSKGKMDWNMHKLAEVEKILETRF